MSNTGRLSDELPARVPAQRQTCGHDCDCHPLIHALSVARNSPESAKARFSNLMSAVETWCAEEGIES